MKALRFSLGSLFGLAAVLKMGDPRALEAAIANYRLLPSSWIGITAVLLPWLELVPATTLILGLWLEASALILGTLSLVFGGAVATVLWRHLDVNCGCFRGAAPVSYLHLVLNIALVALAVVLFRRARAESRP